MAKYSDVLAQRPHIVVFTKRDLLPADEAMPTIEAPAASKILAISSVAQQGLEDLRDAIWEMLRRDDSDGDS